MTSFQNKVFVYNFENKIYKGLKIILEFEKIQNICKMNKAFENMVLIYN
jgi:hypothetical protein